MTITSPAELRDARQRARLSYSELERMTGIDRHVIAGIEHGGEHLRKLADTLDPILSCANCGTEVTR